MKWILVCCVLGALFLVPPNACAQTFSDNQVKGAFMYKITKFIRWEVPENKVKICLIGDKEDQSGETIGKTFTFMASKDKAPFIIAPRINAKDIKTCHMLFIGTKSEPTLQDILAVLDGKPIVTISDIDSFTRRGGMFGFSKKSDNLTVELNFSKAKENNININSALRDMISVVE